MLYLRQLQNQLYSHCRNGGWILGYMIDGTQAEYVPRLMPTTALFRCRQRQRRSRPAVERRLADRTRNRRAIRRCQTNDTVFIAGAGPVGMSALLTAQLYSPAAIIVCDMDENRLKLAKELGATIPSALLQATSPNKSLPSSVKTAWTAPLKPSASPPHGICAKTSSNRAVISPSSAYTVNPLISNLKNSGLKTSPSQPAW